MELVLIEQLPLSLLLIYKDDKNQSILFLVILIRTFE